MSEPRLRFVCRECRSPTGPAQFENVDMEFNSRRPLCRSCQNQADLRGQTCEYCDAPAEFSTAGGPLCDYHFDHYVSAYRERD